MATMVLSALNKGKIFDPIRKKWVIASKEEKVRQALILRMIQDLSYPKGLLCVEKALSEIPPYSPDVPDRRVDLLVFAKSLKQQLIPLLMVECKEDRSMQEIAKKQIMGYNHFIQAPFIAIASPEGIECGFWNASQQSYQFFSYLPSYTTLIQVVQHAK